MTDKSRKNNEADISKSQLETFARCLLPEIIKFYESEEGRREFAEWKAKQNNQTENTVE